MRLIGRRNFVAAIGLAAGTPLLLPLVRSLIREAQGAEASKKLLIILGNYSFRDDHFLPVRQTSDSDFDLNPVMKALQPYKSDLIAVANPIVPGLASNGGHGVMDEDYLSCRKSPDWYHPQGPTIDRFLATKLGTSDRLSSLSLVTGTENPNGNPQPSTDGFDKPYPSIIAPLDAYKKAFMDGVPAAQGTDPNVLLRRDQSLLDFVTSDIARLNARLAAPEREKLDRYTESLREIEKNLTIKPVVTCSAPAAPGAELGKQLPPSNSMEQTYFEAHLDMAVLSLACGVTHVALVSYSGDYPAPIGPRAGISDTGDNGTHGYNHLNDLNLLSQITTFRMEKVAGAVAKLRDLGHQDTALVAYGDSNGNVHHQSGDAMFFMTIGKLGYFTTNQFIRFDRPSDDKMKGPTRRGLGEYYVSIANALGVSIDTFGDPAFCQGPMPGLKA